MTGSVRAVSLGDPGGGSPRTGPSLIFLSAPRVSGPAFRTVRAAVIADDRGLCRVMLTPWPTPSWRSESNPSVRNPPINNRS